MVSVIIPSYNRAGTIERSARSVLEQTQQDIELIIVDDCSSDNTREVVESINDPRIRYIRHEKNKGACAARNTGIDAAKGEFIAFQDSDDEWRPEKLRLQLEALKHYSADICFCKMERHGYAQNKERLFPDLSAGVVDYKELVSRSLISTQTILAKSEVFEKYRFDPDCKRMQDYDWTIRAAENKKVCFTDKVLVDVYLQTDSISSTDKKKLLDIYSFFTVKYEDRFSDHPELGLRLLERLAFYKSCLGYKADAEYRKMFSLKKNPKYLCKYGLAKTGLLKTVYRKKK